MPICIQHLEDEALGTLVDPLADGHIERAVGRVHPAVRYQCQTRLLRHLVGQLCLYPVRLGHALKAAEREAVDMALVAHCDQPGHRFATMVPDAFERDGRRRYRHGKRRLRMREAFVDEYLPTFRMIHDEQRNVIKKVGFPKVGRDAQVIETITGLQLIAVDAHPVLGL